jgi:hypothetical protein
MRTIKFPVSCILIIMYLLKLLNREETPAEADPRPTHCNEPNCSGRNFHKHGSYIRKCIHTRQEGPVYGRKSQRYLCVACRATQSIPIPGFYRYQRVELVTQQEIIQGASSEVLEEACTPDTMKRWKRIWPARAEQVSQKFKQLIYRIRNDLDGQCIPEIQADPIRYLGYLIAQVTENMPCILEVISAMYFGTSLRQSIPHKVHLESRPP